VRVPLEEGEVELEDVIEDEDTEVEMEDDDDVEEEVVEVEDDFVDDDNAK